jgi:hypothetical protein
MSAGEASVSFSRTSPASIGVQLAFVVAGPVSRRASLRSLALRIVDGLEIIVQTKAQDSKFILKN